jgi:hypothetical protein
MFQRVRIFAKGLVRTLAFFLAMLLILGGTIGFVLAFAGGAEFDADIAAVILVSLGLVVARRSLS